MSIEITAKVTTVRGTHDIILPQSQNDFDKSLTDMGFYHWDYTGHKIENARSGSQELDRALAYAGDIEELNYLAQILDGLNADEMETFNDILKADGDTPSMINVVNMAYNVSNINFNIERSIQDIDDLGRLYAEENYAAADKFVINNTDENGEIDYEGIGVDLQLSQGGVFSDCGYISNYDEMTTAPYDGKFFLPFQMPQAGNTVTYYFPLDVKMNGKNDYGYDNEEYEYMDEYSSISSAEAVCYKDEILAQIEKDNRYFDTNRLLAEFFSKESALHDKVYSMRPTVEEHGGGLWGAMVMRTAGELTLDEISELKDYITGQNSDGWGESFEQREIKVPNGELNVSFWSSEKGYAIYTPEEFQGIISKRQAASAAAPPKNILPDCPMIGSDGNVFSLIGLVSRTLKEHDMPEKAEEMRERVTLSGSYSAALAIMTEYVNPVSQDDMRQSDGGFGLKM